MKQWITEYANRADFGAPYSGPLLHAETAEDAQTLLEWVRGPNDEPLTLLGELVYWEPPDQYGDTRMMFRRP